MKRLAGLIITMFVFLGAMAQENKTFSFGYLSYEAAIQSMPEYALVQQKMKALQEQFQAETLRVEDEFNRKYEDFLEGQKDYPRTILLKRQSELQDMMQRNLKFKQQGKLDLAEAERKTLAPLRARLNETIATVARQRHLALVINTDSNACPFIEPAMGVDLNTEIKEKLQK